MSPHRMRCYSKWKTLFLSCDEKHVPPKKKRRCQEWISDGSVKLINERREMKAMGMSKTAEYTKKSKEIKFSLKKDKDNQIQRVCTQLEEQAQRHHSRDLFHAVKELSSKPASKSATIKASDGTVLTEEAEIKERWKEYGVSLFSSDEAETVLEPFVGRDEQEPNILVSEVISATKAVPANKVPGVDGIPAEFFRNLSAEGVNLIHELCNKVWKSGVWPTKWKQSVFVPLYKKGDKKVCENYRTIALIPHLSKILLHILNRRLEQHYYREISPNQAGYVAGRGTRDHISNCRRIIEKYSGSNKKLFMCFVDYVKAFDCVQHWRMFKVLLEMGFPKHLVQLIQRLYFQQTAQVRTDCGLTECFSIEKGTRQGCILSPRLFNLYAEHIMRETLAKIAASGASIGGRKVLDLRYADDTAVFAESCQELQSIITALEQESESMGLRINAAKTKVMAVNEAAPVNINVGGNLLEQIQHFTYLGAIITSTGDDFMEVRTRAGKAKAAMTRLTRVWKSPRITKQTKIRLVKALIFPIFTYGAESWTISKRTSKKISAFEMWCWRKLLRVPWVKKRTNASIRREIGLPCTLVEEVHQQQLKYFGHVMRRGGASLEKNLVDGRMSASRRRGRPRCAFIQTLAERAGRTVQALRQATADRDGWRSLCKSSKPPLEA